MQTHAAKVRFDWQLMAEDTAAKGWTKLELADRAGVSDMTVIRFFRGEQQTARTAKKLSRALSQSVQRYIIKAVHPQGLDQQLAPSESIPTERRQSAEDRRKGLRRRENRHAEPSRGAESLGDRRKASRSETSR